MHVLYNLYTEKSDTKRGRTDGHVVTLRRRRIFTMGAKYIEVLPRPNHRHTHNHLQNRSKHECRYC